MCLDYKFDLLCIRIIFLNTNGIYIKKHTCNFEYSNNILLYLRQRGIRKISLETHWFEKIQDVSKGF